MESMVSMDSAMTSISRDTRQQFFSIVAEAGEIMRTSQSRAEATTLKTDGSIVTEIGLIGFSSG